MARNTSIVLGEHFDAFIKSEIESGRYSSASEIVRMGLRMLESETKKINLINQALVVGEESGEALPFNNDEFKKQMRKKMKRDA